MAISPAQAKRERAALLRSIERDLRSKDRARLLALRETIRGHRRSQREAIRRARATCARRRDVPSQRQVLAWQRQAKKDARAACDADLSAARKLADPVARSRAEHAAERTHQRQLRAIERGIRQKEKGRPGVRRAVRRQESDDEVRGNIPPELVYLFERVKRQIRGTDRKSRTEAFLEYVEQHPDEQWQGLEDRTDEVIRELERRQAMPNPKKRARAKKARRGGGKRRPRKVTASRTTTRVTVKNPESRKAQKHRLLGRIRREATTAAIERLRGNVAKAMRHDHAVDRMTREAERQGWGDFAYEAEERGRQAGDRFVRQGRSNPTKRNPRRRSRRPPRRWFDRCLATVTAQRYARDPAAVCGAAWWNMPASQREATVRRWERGSPRERRLAVAVAKAERNRTHRRKKKTRRR